MIIDTYGLLMHGTLAMIPINRFTNQTLNTNVHRCIRNSSSNVRILTKSLWHDYIN